MSFNPQRESDMSKLNVGVGEEFPLADDSKQTGEQHVCAQYWRHRRHRHGPRAIGALLILPAAAASVTAAIVYPLATLGVIGGLGLAAAAHRRRRWQAYRDERRARRNAQDKPSDVPPAAPKENV
jgi:hypothetical protein